MPNTDTNDCVKTILGRPVPLIIIHALVSLRGAIKSVKNIRLLSSVFHSSDFRRASKTGARLRWNSTSSLLGRRPLAGKPSQCRWSTEWSLLRARSTLTCLATSSGSFRSFIRKSLTNCESQLLQAISFLTLEIIFHYKIGRNFLSYILSKALPTTLQDNHAESKRNDKEAPDSVQLQQRATLCKASAFITFCKLPFKLLKTSFFLFKIPSSLPNLYKNS